MAILRTKLRKIHGKTGTKYTEINCQGVGQTCQLVRFKTLFETLKIDKK